jgi:glycosyltransferase involved in cell wall biosynthesis
MHIAIDARALNWPGIGRYIRELTNQLLQLQGPCEFHLFINHEEQASLFIGSGQTPQFTVIRSKVHSLSEQIELPWHLRQKKIDLFHAPSSLVAPFWVPCPIVLTVHDLLFKASPQFLSGIVARSYFNIIHDRSVARAGRIITVSDFTRKELQRFHPGAAAKARTVHNGIAGAFFERATPAAIEEFKHLAGITGPYFLAVGSLKRHKNFVAMLRAFAELKNRHSDPLQLVIIAKRDVRNPDENVAAVVHALALSEHVVFIDNLTEAQLSAAYSGAEAFISTSLYEGFGLPIAEAMACLTPVIVSDIEVFREVTSGHALYADPHSVASIIRAMRRVLDDKAGCATIARGAARHSRNFSWATAAGKTLAIYGEAMGAHQLKPVPEERA